ncbi:hypothetical protein ARMGADRAFT_1071011 [Armillaria gallica]|uniref:Uncharacterized protein n=1 Tax=Armillaria gallica TaxID=47427 RepID=A0A2H3EAX4_ARMGA|nr:hypothetical protein ARMGADRAFT_1071011 [Armillaria gallica]
MSGTSTCTKAKGGQPCNTASDSQNATTSGPTAQTMQKRKNSTQTPLAVMEEPKKHAQNTMCNQDRATGKLTKHPMRRMGEGSVGNMQHRRDDMTNLLTDLLHKEVKTKLSPRPGSTLDGSPVVVPIPVESHASPTTAYTGPGDLPGAFGLYNAHRNRVGSTHSAPVNRNWSEVELAIDDDGDEQHELPIDYRLNEFNDEEHGSGGSIVTEDSSEHEEFSESELSEDGSSNHEEGPDPEQEMHEALRSDHAAYDFAIREGAEWTGPQADTQQAQEVLNGMSDEQCTIVWEEMPPMNRDTHKDHPGHRQEGQTHQAAQENQEILTMENQEMNPHDRTAAHVEDTKTAGK